VGGRSWEGEKGRVKNERPPPNVWSVLTPMRLINCNCHKTEKVPIHKKPPKPVSWTKSMPPERRRENGVGREEGRRSVSALYHELLRQL